MKLKYTYLLNLLFFFLANSIFVNGQNINAQLKISGEVKTPLQLSLEDISKMKHSIVMVKARDGKENIYSGVPIQDLLGLAGVSLGRDLSGENLSKYLLVRCADGYEVVFSLAEMDSSFTDRKILLADSMNHMVLPLQRGPFQLAVPGEKRPARSCTQVLEFVIRFAK